MPKGIKKLKQSRPSYRQRKEKKEKIRVAIVSVVIVAAFVFVFVAMILFPRTSPIKIVYEADLIVMGSVGEGFITPTFGVKSDKKITVKITNFKSNGVSMKVIIQGGGNYWHQIFEGSTFFSKTVPEESVYSVKFSVNTLYDIGGNISFHVKIYVGV